VIDNLISNAIKYSPQGGKVLITAKRQDQEVLVSVEDHGIGIDNNHTQKIFDRFYRIDDLQVKNASGFGIGLYLCADIIARHDGKIGLKSEPGVGSNFYFSLPVQSGH
jgi:two-component system sensor histidine kinase VicK